MFISKNPISNVFVECEMCILFDKYTILLFYIFYLILTLFLLFYFIKRSLENKA